MKQLAKKLIQPLVRGIGYDIVRYKEEDFASQKKQRGIDPFADIQHYLNDTKKPTILDVGANVGQTASQLVSAYPDSEIHSFEPSPHTFKKLQTNLESFPNVKCWNRGVGAIDGTLQFNQNNCSVMSSFLEPSKFSWGKVSSSIDVEVVTPDTFAKQQGIEYIHLLKSDTQGFDFEVFKGARKLMEEKKIALIYFEFIFSDMYKNLPSFDQVYRYLVENDFLLVSFYDFHFQQEVASWTDALFISRSFHEKRIEQNSGQTS